MIEIDQLKDAPPEFIIAVEWSRTTQTRKLEIELNRMADENLLDTPLAQAYMDLLEGLQALDGNEAAQ